MTKKERKRKNEKIIYFTAHEREDKRRDRGGEGKSYRIRREGASRVFFVKGDVTVNLVESEPA